MAKAKVPFEHSIAKQDRHFLTDNISVHPKPVNICYEISWHFLAFFWLLILNAAKERSRPAHIRRRDSTQKLYDVKEFFRENRSHPDAADHLTPTNAICMSIN